MELTAEQFEELKQQVLMELEERKKQERKNGYNMPLCKVQRKYHSQLVDINAGRTWDIIRQMTAYLMGYRMSKNIPLEKHEESAKIAEDLCIKVITAFGGTIDE